MTNFTATLLQTVPVVVLPADEIEFVITNEDETTTTIILNTGNLLEYAIKGAADLNIVIVAAT